VKTERLQSVLLDITAVDNDSRTDERDREVEGEYFAFHLYGGPIFGCCGSVSVITFIRYFPTTYSSEFPNEDQRNKILRTQYVIMKNTDKLSNDGMTLMKFPNLIQSEQ
jgi:hypothetical protein